jgi:hypothetical protein
MFIFCRKRRRYCVHRIGGFAATILLAVAALVIPATPASAQHSLFDTFFGRRNSAPASASAFADPFSQWNPFGSRPQDAQRVETGTAYCVRLCDGRYFPIDRHGDATPAQACSSFCPASHTKIYSGGTIDQAVGPDGKPYRELSTAFTYREKIVAGCTCNGRDAFGLVNTPIEDDATLRPGDIVATRNGLAAYNGGAKRQAASFTPVGSYSGLSADLRRKLTETKVAPAPATPAPLAQAKQDDTTSSIRNGKSKRVQAAR